MADTKCWFSILIVLSLCNSVITADTLCNMKMSCADVEDYIDRLVCAHIERKIKSRELLRLEDLEALIEKKVAERVLALREEMDASTDQKFEIKDIFLKKKLQAEFGESKEEKTATLKFNLNMKSDTELRNDFKGKIIHEDEIKPATAVRRSIPGENELASGKNTDRNKVEIKEENERDAENESSKDVPLADEKIDTLQREIVLLKNKTVDSKQEVMERNIRPRLCYNEGNSNSKRSAVNVAHPVGFSACITSDVVTIGDKHTIVFDKVISNTGGAYHYHTGIFIAPLKGQYVFSLSATSSPNKGQQLAFIKDGVKISLVFPNAVGTNTYQTASNQWVIELEQGSEVWIRTSGGGQIFGQCFTVFSGFLLREME